LLLQGGVRKQGFAGTHAEAVGRARHQDSHGGVRNPQLLGDLLIARAPRGLGHHLPLAPSQHEQRRGLRRFGRDDHIAHAFSLE